MTLPRLDPYLASRGEQLEDLSAVAATQPFASGGPSLHRDDLALLAKAAGARLRHPEPTPSLVAAGLMTAARELTDDGRTVAALLTGPTGRLRVESGRGRAPLTLDVSFRGGLALAVATASPGAFVDAPHGDHLRAAATTVGLDVLDGAAVPALVASWVGLGPAWSLATEPAELSEELVLSRVDEPTVEPPPGADANLREAWRQPWFLWTAQASGSDTGLVAINAGPRGHLALVRAAQEGNVGLRPILSTTLFLRVTEMAARAATARSA